jgi:predicted small lipoprotein YifL
MTYKKMIVLLLLSFAVCSCGIKGDLYLPEKQEKSE